MPLLIHPKQFADEHVQGYALRCAEASLATYTQLLEANIAEFPAKSLRPKVRHRVCLKCLETDRVPYLRSHWFAPFYLACIVHKTPMVDRCTRCARILFLDSLRPPRCKCGKLVLATDQAPPHKHVRRLISLFHLDDAAVTKNVTEARDRASSLAAAFLSLHRLIPEHQVTRTKAARYASFANPYSEHLTELAPIMEDWPNYARQRVMDTHQLGSNVSRLFYWAPLLRSIFDADFAVQYEAVGTMPCTSIREFTRRAVAFNARQICPSVRVLGDTCQEMFLKHKMHRLPKTEDERLELEQELAHELLVAYWQRNDAKTTANYSGFSDHSVNWLVKNNFLPSWRLPISGRGEFRIHLGDVATLFEKLRRASRKEIIMDNHVLLSQAIDTFLWKNYAGAKFFHAILRGEPLVVHQMRLPTLASDFYLHYSDLQEWGAPN
jgi:hypothetical protein